MALPTFYRRLRRAHPLLALLALHAASGFLLAAVLVAALIAFDTGGIGRLLETSAGWPFAVMLWFFVGLTFASALMGSAIMTLHANDRDADGGRRPASAVRCRVLSSAAVRPAR